MIIPKLKELLQMKKPTEKIVYISTEIPIGFGGGK